MAVKRGEWKVGSRSERTCGNHPAADDDVNGSEVASDKEPFRRTTDHPLGHINNSISHKFGTEQHNEYNLQQTFFLPARWCSGTTTTDHDHFPFHSFHPRFAYNGFLTNNLLFEHCNNLVELNKKICWDTTITVIAHECVQLKCKVASNVLHEMAIHEKWVATARRANIVQSSCFEWKVSYFSGKYYRKTIFCSLSLLAANVLARIRVSVIPVQWTNLVIFGGCKVCLVSRVSKTKTHTNMI